MNEGEISPEKWQMMVVGKKKKKTFKEGRLGRGGLMY